MGFPQSHSYEGVRAGWQSRQLHTSRDAGWYLLARFPPGVPCFYWEFKGKKEFLEISTNFSSCTVFTLMFFFTFTDHDIFSYSTKYLIIISSF